MACIFCEIVGGRQAASFAHQNDELVAFMDIYPMRPGHVLVLPRQHAERISELPSGAVGRLFETAGRLGDALRASELGCDDVNIVLNDGRAANQTVPHVHVHVVPRVRGDTLTLIRKLLQRPLQPVLGKPARDELDRQAAAISAALTTSP